MLTRLTIILEKPKDVYLNQNISSLFQGVIMEQMTLEYGEYLHQSQLKPYSQYLKIENEQIIWNIYTLELEAKNKILESLMRDDFNEVNLRHKKIMLPIIEKIHSNYTYESLVKDTFFAVCPRIIQIEFLSPTAFRKSGTYMFYPDIRMIFQSLMNKFDVFSSENSIGSLELLEDIENFVQIIGYKLQSRKFQLEGVKIPAFVGQITIKVTGPQQLVNVVHLLLKYGEYSGVGIKTAIGMGALQIINRGKKND